MSKRTEATKRFAFRARLGDGMHGKRPDGTWGNISESAWSAFLPHQCDEWQVCGEIEADGERATKSEALADLAAFIAEAQETRRRLDAEEWATP